MKILFVDDDIHTGDSLYRQYFDKINPDIQYNWVRSSDEAFKALQSGAYDIAFIDYQLDVLNGLDLIAAVDKDIKTKLIILSGHDKEFIELKIKEKKLNNVSVMKKKMYEEQMVDLRELLDE